MWIKRQVVMLPTNEVKGDFSKERIYPCLLKHSWMFDKEEKGKLIFADSNIRTPTQLQNLYFLSDEKPVTGDWVIPNNSKYGNRPWKFMEAPCPLSYWGCADNCKKIIATTDSSIACIKDTLSIPQRRGLTNHYPTEKWVLPQPSQSFIKKFVEEYNKGNIITEVMVEYDSPEICENPLDSKFASLKVNSKDNTTAIRKVKDSWNKEEVIKSIKNFAEKFVANTNTAYKQKEINEWIEENL